MKKIEKTNTKIYIARHGQAEHNADKSTGGMETPLTEEGRIQIYDTAEVAKAWDITDIISSDMARCKQSTEILRSVLEADGQKVNVYYSDLLRERSMGVFARQDGREGVSVKNLPHDFDFNPNKYRAETKAEVFRRAGVVAKRIVRMREFGMLGENVLVMGHGMCNDMLQYCLRQGPEARFDLKEYLQVVGRQANASVVRVDLARAKLREFGLVYGDEKFRSSAIEKIERELERIGKKSLERISESEMN